MSRHLDKHQNSMQAYILYVMAEVEDGFDTKYVKIGVTRDEKSLIRRESNLGTGNPRLVEMRWTWTFRDPGQALEIESRVKDRLEPKRVPEKEWFSFPTHLAHRPSTQLMRIVDDIIEEWHQERGDL